MSDAEKERKKEIESIRDVISMQNIIIKGLKEDLKSYEDFFMQFVYDATRELDKDGWARFNITPEYIANMKHVVETIKTEREFRANR